MRLAEFGRWLRTARRKLNEAVGDVAPVGPRGPWHSGRGLYLSGSSLPSDATLAPECDLLARECATQAKDGHPKFAYLALQALPENLPKAGVLKAACQRHGVSFGVWDQPARFADTLTEFAQVGAAPEFYIAVEEGEVEHPVALGIPRIVCTNFGGLGGQGSTDTERLADMRAKSRPWINAGYDCQPEVYTVDNPSHSVAGQMFEAMLRGWTSSAIFPVVGVYHDYALARYPAWNAVYLREGMQPADWDF